jgi:2-polyprenyl-3-methyl-5-hydroxy-6-metoxy-1,4-benzoquinol methylase
MEYISGVKIDSHYNDFGADIAFNDHKISFILKHTKNKKILDLGCVMHNPENAKSRYWLHRATYSNASSVLGLDLYNDGVKSLKKMGYNVVHGDAQNFKLDDEFDIIIAADLIEHLHNLEGFFLSCKLHMKKNSKLLISTPNPWYWKNVLMSFFGTVRVNQEHTCWFCPVTLAQISSRFGLSIESISYGSRYKRDRFMPLPKGLKHTSFHAVLKLN